MSENERLLKAAAIFTILGVILAAVIYVTGRPSLGGLVKRLAAIVRSSPSPSPTPAQAEASDEEESAETTTRQYYSVVLENRTAFEVAYSFPVQNNSIVRVLKPGQRGTITLKNYEIVIRYDSDPADGFQEELATLSPALVTDEKPDDTSAAPLYRFTDSDGLISIRAANTTSAVIPSP
jgi:hypothetical protein